MPAPGCSLGGDLHHQDENGSLIKEPGRILEELREQIRLAEGRDAGPPAGVSDSQSVKAADTGRAEFPALPG
ncbi:hypothetical protein Ade02nite_79120 [Paractinoplanes deccanensis]|uniref:Uncharacterized protein n=1 Tax=Paractinoplanes deccanensis TaxID=113561 RepID=A0ABQ3YH02_9ACTN|nr:hypothetical protein [Actinoplanes deccanensis]GID79271.1 hypothetical protein Ade02nite_79120 [Actinoplanes deccanensis]